MATTKIAYEVNGEVATNLKEVATILGVPKVTKKDIQEGGSLADQVSLIDVEDTGEAVELDTKEETDVSLQDTTADEEEPIGEATGEESIPEDDTQESEDDTEEETVDTADTVSDEDIDITPDEILESMPEFEEGEDGLAEFKEFFKDLDTPTAEYLAKGLGLEWKPTDHANIHRMRVSMAMQRYFFPELFKPKEKKKKSKYGDFSTEELYEMAEANDVDFKKSGKEPIDRMRVIMALKKEGHLTD